MGTLQVGPGAAATHSAAPVHPGPSGQCRSCLSACRAWGFGCHHRAPPRRSCLCGSRGPGDPGPSHAPCCPPVTTCGGQERGLGAPQSQLSQAEARMAGSGPAAPWHSVVLVPELLGSSSLNPGRHHVCSEARGPYH